MLVYGQYYNSLGLKFNYQLECNESWQPSRKGDTAHVQVTQVDIMYTRTPS